MYSKCFCYFILCWRLLGRLPLIYPAPLLGALQLDTKLAWPPFCPRMFSYKPFSSSPFWECLASGAQQWVLMQRVAGRPGTHSEVPIRICQPSPPLRPLPFLPLHQTPRVQEVSHFSNEQDGIKKLPCLLVQLI